MKASFGESLSYQKSDLARLDSVIDKAWGEELPKNVDSLVLTFGAYFGESLRRPSWWVLGLRFGSAATAFTMWGA